MSIEELKVFNRALAKTAHAVIAEMKEEVGYVIIVAQRDSRNPDSFHSLASSNMPAEIAAPITQRAAMTLQSAKPGDSN